MALQGEKLIEALAEGVTLPAVRFLREANPEEGVLVFLDEKEQAIVMTIIMEIVANREDQS